MTPNRDIDSGRFKFGYLASIVLLINYFIGYQYVYPVLSSIIFKPMNGALNPSAQMLSTIITLLISILLVRKPLFRSFRFFIDNLGRNIKIIFKHVGLIYLVNVIMNLIILYLFGDNTSGNQALVESGFAIFPVLYAFTAVIFAPIVEEILFRGVLYQELRKKGNYWIPVAISSLSFGLIHTLPIFLVSSDVSELLFLVVYTAMGYLMTRAYEKTGTIWSSIGVHFMNNLIATVVLLSTLGG